MLTPHDLINRHDPHISDWGPYSKGYIGISHCCDYDSGLRFDLSVFPGLYRRACTLPNVRTESGYHPWEATADLSYYKHRHELLWKDRLYCDISFTKGESEDLYWIQIEGVNRGDKTENLVLHLMANLNYPQNRPLVKTICPEGTEMINALNYHSLIYKENDVRRHLQWDGNKRGEVSQEGAVGGFALSLGESEPAVISWNTTEALPEEVKLSLRYKSTEEISLTNGTKSLILPPSDNWCMADLGSIHLWYKDSLICFSLESKDQVLLDSLFLSQGTAEPVFVTDNNSASPKRERIGERSLILSYSDSDKCYGLLWPEDLDVQVREFHTDTLDELFRETIHEHVNLSLDDGKKAFNHYINIFLRPLCLEAGSTKIMNALICSGTFNEVRTLLLKAEKGELTPPAGKDSSLFPNEILPGGEKYLFSQEKLAATLLTNVVFPIRTRQRYIRHYTPGRWWDSLYTWDSGCIGIGQAELSLDRAVDNLNAYLTEPEDDEAVFIHHGSPVPTQFLVFLSIWNKTQDKKLLAYFFPRLLKYHNFLMGRVPKQWSGQSSTRDLKSGLIRTWDYFYNSGGWDDYPPQKEIHLKGWEDHMTPVINSAFAIRSAKILLQALNSLPSQKEYGELKNQLQDDIDSLAQSLHKYSWDSESGYFAYVKHDRKTKEVVDIFRDERGQNFNCGLDGISPLLAHICTPEQRDSLINKLMNPNHIWSRAGLSTVDQSASYYIKDGYWNGAVWMPHQWFIWKALLDYGKLDEARKIAQTGLDLWAGETDESYNCFEHFLVESGRGAGWHHFGGLSSPALSWFFAYYIPGNINTGYNGWINFQDFSNKKNSMKADITFLKSQEIPALIVTMAPSDEKGYGVTINGKSHSFISPYSGLIEIRLEPGVDHIKLEIKTC